MKTYTLQFALNKLSNFVSNSYEWSPHCAADKCGKKDSAHNVCWIKRSDYS